MSQISFLALFLEITMPFDVALLADHLTFSNLVADNGPFLIGTIL